MEVRVSDYNVRGPHISRFQCWWDTFATIYSCYYTEYVSETTVKRGFLSQTYAFPLDTCIWGTQMNFTPALTMLTLLDECGMFQI